MTGQPPVSINQARDRTIELLSAHFAQDDLSLEELERRIERAYQATNIADLDALIADLRGGATPAALPVTRGAGARVAAPVSEHERVVAIMSETKRRGMWMVPQNLDVYALMADTTIDLTEATLPSGVAEINLHALMAAVKVIVPPGVHVDDRVHMFMGSSSNDAEKSPTPPPGAPVIRLTGFAMMAELKVRVRRRD